MRVLTKSVSTLLLGAVAGFCAFGYAATFEPPGFPVFRWIYGLVGLACLAAIVGISLKGGHGLGG